MNKFETPIMEVVLLSAADVIATSDDVVEGGADVGGGEWE